MCLWLYPINMNSRERDGKTGGRHCFLINLCVEDIAFPAFWELSRYAFETWKGFSEHMERWLHLCGWWIRGMEWYGSRASVCHPHLPDLRPASCVWLLCRSDYLYSLCHFQGGLWEEGTMKGRFVRTPRHMLHDVGFVSPT